MIMPKNSLFIRSKILTPIIYIVIFKTLFMGFALSGQSGGFTDSVHSSNNHRQPSASKTQPESSLTADQPLEWTWPDKIAL